MTRRLNISVEIHLPLDFMTMATVVYGSRGSGKSTLGAVVAGAVPSGTFTFSTWDTRSDLGHS